jgi:hypothetical protein
MAAEKLSSSMQLAIRRGLRLSLTNLCAQHHVLPCLQEEQLLELVMNGMRVAGVALALQALSTVALGKCATRLTTV